MSKRENQAYSFVFTLNNPVPAELEVLKAGHPDIEYMVYGHEVAPTTGTPHLQGYIRMLKRVRFAQVHKILTKRLSLQVAKGGVDANFNYCSKDGNYVEYGTKPLEGQKKATETKKLSREDKALIVHEVLEETHSAEAVFNALAGEYYYNGKALIHNWLIMKRPIHRPSINVWWFTGPPGIGKTKLAHELLSNPYIKDPKTKWWNGYMLEEDVIIDDFGKNSIDLNHLLRWFDRYKCQVESKGGMMPLYATNIIITSNFMPSEVFLEETYNNEGRKVQDVHPQLAALSRRIKIVTFGGKYPEEFVSCAPLAICRATPQQFSIMFKAHQESLKPEPNVQDVPEGRLSRDRSPERFEECLPKDLLD